jgi:putative inorganic carbon (hco3(-)) transporter
MRDLIVIAIVLAGCIATLRRPWIGIMLWTWLSIMNPHRYTYGIAYSAPLAAATVAFVFLGALMSKERESPLKGSPVTWLVCFVVWMNLSWLAGLDVANDYDMWKKVMKIDFMILVALMVLRSKQHIFALTVVCAASIALLAIKGGIFTLMTGGAQRVWGPPGSFIDGNNEFALAIVMAIPLLRFLQMQVANAWPRHLLTGAMILCAMAALGSQSRGAFLAISAMAITLWWRGKRKFGAAVILLAVSLPLIAFMPDSWTQRMDTIESYEEDGSAMGRINAWWVAWGIGLNYPTGVGFNTATPELFSKYGRYIDIPRAAHSIYFQVLGSHGFIGLFLFLGMWISCWRAGGWLRSRKDLVPEAKWAADMGAMCQVALVGYAVGGAFLSLAYFDLPYDILALLVLTRVWVEKQTWKTEPDVNPRWMTMLGLAAVRKER